MNLYSVAACVAAVSFVTMTTACEAKEASPVQKEPPAAMIESKPTKFDKWPAIATTEQATMAEVQGNTFGIPDWRVPNEADRAQGIIGVGQLGPNCLVLVSVGILSDPGSFTVDVESRFNDTIVDPQIIPSNEGTAGIQRVIDSNTANCA